MRAMATARRQASEPRFGVRDDGRRGRRRIGQAGGRRRTGWPDNGRSAARFSTTSATASWPSSDFAARFEIDRVGEAILLGAGVSTAAMPATWSRASRRRRRAATIGEARPHAGGGDAGLVADLGGGGAGQPLGAAIGALRPSRADLDLAGAT